MSNQHASHAVTYSVPTASCSGNTARKGNPPESFVRSAGHLFSSSYSSTWILTRHVVSQLERRSKVCTRILQTRKMQVIYMCVCSKEYIETVFLCSFDLHSRLLGSACQVKFCKLYLVPAEAFYPIEYRRQPSGSRFRSVCPRAVSPQILAPGLFTPGRLAPGTFIHGLFTPGRLAPGTFIHMAVCPTGRDNRLRLELFNARLFASRCVCVCVCMLLLLLSACVEIFENFGFCHTHTHTHTQTQSQRWNYWQ